MNFYNKTLVTQIKYRGIDDKLIIYTHRGFNKGVMEIEIDIDDFVIIKNNWFLGNYYYIKGKKNENFLYLIPTKGIFHEKEVFDYLFDANKKKEEKPKKDFIKVDDYYKDLNEIKKEKIISDIENFKKEKKIIELTVEETLENVKKSSEEYEKYINISDLGKVNNLKNYIRNIISPWKFKK
jgi:hypothetical protein